MQGKLGTNIAIQVSNVSLKRFNHKYPKIYNTNRRPGLLEAKLKH